MLPTGMTAVGSSSCSLNASGILQCAIKILVNNASSGTVNYGTASNGVLPSPDSNSYG